jgi:hypothetical protein
MVSYRLRYKTQSFRYKPEEDFCTTNTGFYTQAEFEGKAEIQNSKVETGFLQQQPLLSFYFLFNQTPYVF